ncbi:hypothetical protein JCM10449v2_007217 [Rhodotorula kratochvilovae]
MRPSPLRLLTRPVPLASIPPHALRLPPTPTPRPNLAASSPTLDRLLKSFAPGPDAPAQLPPNLRVNEFVPRRKEFLGVKRGHRDLLRRLRREA